MTCDLSRLQVAIAARLDADERDWRMRFRVAGHEIEEPVPEPRTDEEAIEQAREAMASARRAWSLKDGDDD